MTIAVGDLMPDGRLHTMTDSGVVEVKPQAFFAHKRAVLFGVPAAFTPGCTQIHLPSYVKNATKIKQKGFDIIACLAVHDAWVMDAWAQTAHAKDHVVMLADGNGDYTRALGIDRICAHGPGIRCRRFSMIVQNGRRIDKFRCARNRQTAAPHTCSLVP